MTIISRNLGYQGQSHYAHLATVAVEAALSRDLTQFREKVRLLRAHSASPALPPAPAKVAAISQVRQEDIEEVPSEPRPL